MKLLEHDRAELQGQHREVDHDAPGDFEHHRVLVVEDDRVPDAVGPSEVVHQRDTDQDVAEERGEHRGPKDGLELLEAEHVHAGSDGEPACCERDAAHDVEPDPQTPGEVVAQAGGGAEAEAEAHDCGVCAHEQHGQQEDAPEGDLHVRNANHECPPSPCPPGAPARRSRSESLLLQLDPAPDQPVDREQRQPADAHDVRNLAEHLPGQRGIRGAQDVAGEPELIERDAGDVHHVRAAGRVLAVDLLDIAIRTRLDALARLGDELIALAEHARARRAHFGAGGLAVLLEALFRST